MGVRGAFVLGAVLAFLILTLGPTVRADEGIIPLQAPDDWPMYGGSAAHNFSNGAAPPSMLGRVWTLAGNATLGSAVSSDGFAYVADVDTIPGPTGPNLVVHKIVTENGSAAPAFGAWATRVTLGDAVALAPGRSPAVDANRVYVLFTAKYATDYGEVLVALNAGTGAVDWTFNQTTRWTSGSPAATRSAPLLAGSLVIFGSQDGRVYALNAATGTIAWWFPTGTPVNTVPAAEGTIIYVTAGTQLRFLDINGLADGDAGPAEGGGYTGDEIVAPVDVGVGIEASPVVTGSYVYVAAGGDLWALDRTFGGSPVWSATTTWGSVGTPAILGDTIVVRRSDDRVYAFDRTTGQIQWVRGGMRATGEADVAGADGRVFLTATSTIGLALVTFDATDGRIVHQASLPAGPLGSPVAVADLVLVSSGSELLAFRGQPDVAALSTDVVLNAEQASNGVARGNLTIAIRNFGSEPAIGARVRVYDGSPGPNTLIADFIVGDAAKPIKAGGRSEGNVTATRDWSVGRHEVWVVVDPVPNEENTANNQAVVILYVEPGQPKTIVVGGGPTYLALLLGVLIGGAVLYIPLRRLRDVRRKDEEKAPAKP